MRNKFKLAILAAVVSLSPIAYADPPVNDGGNVTCNPGCDYFECGVRYCVLCNKEGCTIIEA